MTGPLRGRRAPRRSCPLRHGHGKCELSGEAGRMYRAEEKRRWRRDVAADGLITAPGRFGDQSGHPPA